MPHRILIVDDMAETRKSIRRLLEFEEDFEVVGEAADGDEAVRHAKALVPDCILMDINMPGRDGIAATEAITFHVPQAAIVIMSVQGEQEYLRKAMIAGARDYLVKPFASDELVQTLRRVCDLEAERRRRQGGVSPPKAPGKVISVFSAKGGAGATSIAVNLAVLLAQDDCARVALVDLDLQFGDVAVLLDLIPSRTLADFAQEEEVDADLIDQYLIRHASGVEVFPAPARPEEAELVRPSHVGFVLDRLREIADFVVVDTARGFGEAVLTSLDKSDQVLFIVTPDVPAIKNARLALDVMKSLSYDEERISVVVNQATKEFGVVPKAVEEHLAEEVSLYCPFDPQTVMASVNEGRPFVLAEPDAAVSQAMVELAGRIRGKAPQERRVRAGILRFLQRASG